MSYFRWAELDVDQKVEVLKEMVKVALDTARDHRHAGSDGAPYLPPDYRDVNDLARDMFPAKEEDK